MALKIALFLSRPFCWKALLLLSACSYLSIFLFTEQSPAWLLWWAPSKMIGLSSALLCALALLLSDARPALLRFEQRGKTR